MLKLIAHLSYIDKYNKLKFTLDDTSREKLVAHCSGANKPYDDSVFTVTLPKHMKSVPADIAAMVGLTCVVDVKLVPYNFTSRAKHNAGDIITGVRLVMTDITLDEIHSS